MAPRSCPATWSCPTTCQPTKWPAWELVEARDARLLYLPPYPPDFNPIELAFSKLKAWQRTVRARTREAQEAVIQDASNWVTERAAKNWFDHCGYHVH